MKIEQFQPREKPRERCLNYGPETLSLRECLAVLLGSGPKDIGCIGLAESILKLNECESLDEASFFRTYEADPLMRLQNIHGLGPAGQARILVALNLCRRFMSYKTKLQKNSLQQEELENKIKRKVPQSLHNSPIEILGFVPYFQNGQVGRFIEVQKGEEMFVSVSSQRIIRSALLCRALGFWLFHNHPSGITRPSEDDRMMTRNVRSLCRQLQIDFCGHWVVSQGQFEKV